MHVFTKIDGKTAVFAVETEDAEEAIKTVRDEVGLKHRPPILALVRGGKFELDEVA